MQYWWWWPWPLFLWSVVTHFYVISNLFFSNIFFLKTICQAGSSLNMYLIVIMNSTCSPLLLTLQTGEKGSLLSTQTTVSWTTVRPGAHIFWQRVLLMTCTFVSSRMSGEIATSKRIVIVHYKDFIFFIYWAWDWQFFVLKFCFYLFCITLFKSIKTLIVLHSYCSMDVILIINTSKYKQYFYLHNKLTCWSFKMTVPPACNITVLQSSSLSG